MKNSNSNYEPCKYCGEPSVLIWGWRDLNELDFVCASCYDKLWRRKLISDSLEYYNPNLMRGNKATSLKLHSE